MHTLFASLRRPSMAWLRLSLTTASLVAMALAGSAGSHWS